MFTIKKLPIVLLIIIHQSNLSKGNGEQCQGADGVHYYCAGFCCPGFGCCSYSSLWYAWALLGLILLMCICGCAGCGARRYYRVSRGRYSPISYTSFSDEVRLTRWRNKYSRTRGRALDVREIQQQARDYNATTTKQNRQVEELPPAYTEPTAPPPPYSYY